MARRGAVGAAIALAYAIGVIYAVRMAQDTGAVLLFNSATWVVWLAPFAGVFAAALTKRHDPRVEGDEVLRHDGAAMLEHWTHGVGTAALLVTGFSLGFMFFPKLVASGATTFAMMNVHFVSVVCFLFGTFYYGANTLLSWQRFKEHLPTKNAISFTIQHYGHLLGVKKYAMPPEDKYFESERMAYLLALAATATVILTGLLKVAAHAVDVPAGVMAFVTPLHGIATIAMALFFVAHVFFAAVLPDSWPILSSMFTGRVSLEYAKAEHAGWVERLEDADRKL
jgi:formate dehydrogenase subunit gamma